MFACSRYCNILLGWQISQISFAYSSLLMLQLLFYIVLYLCALCSPLSTSVHKVWVCSFPLSPHCSLALCLVSLPMYLYLYLLLFFFQRWRFLYLICGEGYLLLSLLLLLLSLSFIVAIRGNALCLHFGCLCYLPTQYMAYVCIYVCAHCLYS